MKRLAVLGLCLCIFPYCAMTAFAEDTAPPNNNAVIEVSIPSEHMLTVTAPDGVTVTLDGVSGNNFNVERLSEPTIAVNIPDGQEIVKVVLNGEDITDKLVNGQYKLPPVYENLALEVETKAAEPTTSTTEPTTSTTEPTTSSSTDSTSSTTTSESSSTTSSDSSKTDNSSSKTDSSASSTTTSSNGGTSNSNDNKTYPNNDSPNTGDIMTVSIGIPAFFLGVAFLMVLLKKRNNEDEE